MAANTANMNWRGRLAGELRRNAKKTVVLAVLLAVLGFVTGREMLRSAGPQDARAAGSGAASPARMGSRPVAKIATSRPEEAGRPDRRRREDAEAGTPITDRDLFTPNPVHFPPQERRPRPAPVATPMEDTVEKAEALRRAVQAQAQALALQSTVIGESPTAIINGQLLRAGDSINGFRVVEITARSCAVEKEGMRITLDMAH